MIEVFDFLDVDGSDGAKAVNKVYFTAHREDFVPFYRRIANDVFSFAKRSCVIYKKKHPDMHIPEDELDFISDMTLVVVPVTRKLLRDKRDKEALREIEYATRHGVTVLPFMMEPRLDRFYESSAFAKRQWVSPDFAGKDAVPYEDKLVRFFNEHFIGDETVESIKEEFSSRIFLSYRKKDRSLAKPLMREIHSEEGMEDVAIWYDEYLPLARDYAVSIEGEMQRSDAVAFLVTDNLTEEGNYVKTVEYPMAMEREEKLILPLEPMGDEGVRERVRADFEGVKSGFPDYVEVSELSGRLERVRKENTPRHKYLLALAYLGGIDVEKDVDRAVKLLSEAAEESYIPAAEKLRSMYSSGEGVERDYGAACEWGERVYRLYLDSPDYGPDHSETKLALATCGMDYASLGNSKKSSVGNFITYFEDGAKRAFRKSERIILDAVDSMRDMEGVNPLDLMCAVSSLASSYKDEGNYAAAIRYYAEAQAMLHEIIRADVLARGGDSSIPSVRFELCEDGSYDSFISDTFDKLEKLYVITTKLNMPYDYSDELLNLLSLASVYYLKRDFKMAVVLGERVRKLCDMTDNKEMMMLAHNMMGSFYRADKQYSRAKSSLTSAHKLALSVFGDERNPFVLCVQLTLAQVYWTDGQFDDAVKCMKSVLRLVSDDAELAEGLPISVFEIESDIRMIEMEKKRSKVMSSKEYKDFEASYTKNRYGKFKL